MVDVKKNMGCAWDSKMDDQTQVFNHRRKA